VRVAVREGAVPDEVALQFENVNGGFRNRTLILTGFSPLA
jgi:hypothetical protein